MEASELRKRNTLAAALIITSLAFGYLWRLIGPHFLHGPTTAKPNSLFAVVTVGLLELGVCYAIWRGKRWAAWLFAVVFVLEVLLPALDYRTLLAGFQQQPMRAVPFLATYVLEGWAMWLLFWRR